MGTSIANWGEMSDYKGKLNSITNPLFPGLLKKGAGSSPVSLPCLPVGALGPQPREDSHGLSDNEKPPLLPPENTSQIEEQRIGYSLDISSLPRSLNEASA